MASIPHVVAGTVALASAQNALIDQVNASTAEAYGTADRSVRPKCAVNVTSYPADTGDSGQWQRIANSTNTMLTWQNELLDTDNMFTPGGSGITLPADGLYLSDLALNLQAQSGTVTGAIGIKLLANTTNPDPGGANEPNVIATQTAPFNSAGEGTVIHLATLLQAAAGAVLRFSVWHNFNNGTPLNVNIWPGFNQRGTAWTVSYIGK